MDWISEIKESYKHWLKQHTVDSWNIVGYKITERFITLSFDSGFTFGYHINQPLWVLL